MTQSYWKTLKRRFLPPLIAFTGKYGMRLLLRTCRIEVHGVDRFVEIAKKSPCIVALWHNRLAAVPEIFHRFASQFSYTAFISKSRDGEPLARLTTSYSIGKVLRVPHNARHHALSQMINLLKSRDSILLITPDGPRGPRYEVKPGLIMAAREAKAEIVPFSWTVDRAWKLKTWDQMMIPKPFSKINVYFGEPIKLTAEADLEQDEQLVHDALSHKSV